MSLPRLSSRVAVAGAWLAAVWATTHWYSWQRTIDLLFGSDVVEYERVARAAPGFPTEALPSQHADRFVPHYLIGLLSDALRAPDRPVYYVAAFVLLGVIVVLVDRALAGTSLGLVEYAVVVGAVVANPYLFRFLAICPGRLADSVFIIGGLLALLGALRTDARLLAAGLVVATFGRSEAVFPLAALAPFAVWFAPARRDEPPRRRALVGLAALAAPLAAYGLVRLADHTFSVRDHPGFFGLTIFGTFRDLPGSGGHLGLHVARIFVGIAAAVALLVAALALRRVVRSPGLPFSFWAALAAGIAVSGEAFILNPVWINGSEPLLAALGAVFLAVAGGIALGATPGRRRLGSWAGWIALAALAVVSLNHRYAWISPVSTKAQFAALTTVAAAVFAVAVFAGTRPRSASSVP